jgi:hypothetical protein
MTKTEKSPKTEHLEVQSRTFPMHGLGGEDQEVRLFWTCTCQDWALKRPCQHVVAALVKLEKDMLKELPEDVPPE